MSGSNIFMQLITATGPVLGEGLLEGFEGSIELKDFSWGMHALKDSTPPPAGLGEMQHENLRQFRIAYVDMCSPVGHIGGDAIERRRGGRRHDLG